MLQNWIITTVTAQCTTVGANGMALGFKETTIALDGMAMVFNGSQPLVK